MEMPKIPQTLSELLDLREKLKAAGQGDSQSAHYVEVLIEQKACEQAEIPWRD